MSDSRSETELHARIDETRRDYEQLRASLEQNLGRYFTDAGDVTDRLLSVVDEFGREHALVLLAERPDDYGARHAAADSAWRESVASYGSDVERLIELHDRLDDLTREREEADGRESPEPLRSINIQGREYEFDAVRSELREIVSETRYPVALERGEELKLTAIERAMRDTKAAKAEPQPDRERTRGR